MGKTIQFLPCMLEQFLQEFLHLSLYVQCYMAEKFEGAFYSYHFFCLEVGRGALQHNQQAEAEK